MPFSASNIGDIAANTIDIIHSSLCTYMLVVIDNKCINKINNVIIVSL